MYQAFDKAKNIFNKAVYLYNKSDLKRALDLLQIEISIREKDAEHSSFSVKQARSFRTMALSYMYVQAGIHSACVIACVRWINYECIEMRAN